MIPSFNNPVFGFHSDAERYSWAAYNIIVSLCSLFGDALILYASFQRDAFQVHKFTVTVMQYIAVADMACAITRCLPTAVSLIANTWVLGDALCYATDYLNRYSFVMGMCLIAVMTSGKFLTLKYPLRSASLNKRMAHRVCIITCIGYMVFLGIELIADKDDIAFDYRVYTCQYRYSAPLFKKFLPFSAIFIFFLPNIVIVATTICILGMAARSARRFGESVQWRGALPVILTATVYCIATIPRFIYFIGRNFMKDLRFHVQYYRISANLTSVNIMANFFIYALTITSFRRFLLSKIAFIQSVFSHAFRNILPSTGNSYLIKSSFNQHNTQLFR